MSEGAPTHRRLPFGTKLLYGVGAAASGVKNRALGGFLMIFYNQVMGLPPATVALAITIALVCDAFFDPSVGQTSDNFRSRWGRRHPFMYAAAIPYALGFFLLWNPPAGLPEAYLFAFMLAALLTIRLFDSFYELPSAAMMPELAPDYNERTGLIAIRWFFGLMSGIVIAILAYQVFMKQNADGSGGILDREGYLAFGITGAAIIFSVIMISSLATHHLIPMLRNAPVRKITAVGMAKEIFTTVKNRNFVVLTLTGMLAAVALGLMSGLAIYFQLYFWEFDQNQLTMLTIASVLSSLVGVTLCTPLSARLGKKRAALSMFILAVFANNTPIVLRILGLMPPNDHPAVFWIILSEQFVFASAGIMTSIIVTSMIADVVEDNEVKTGRRSEGLLFSADNFFKKLVSGAGVLMSGFILTIVAFPRQARPGSVDPEILHNMSLLYVPVSVGLFVTAMVTLSLYSIDKAAHEENLRKLRAIATPAE
jgi:glycoside/pentoside/hexuronide:cation symporter, GPH family